MGPGVVGDAAAQFQRMGIQGTADLPRPTIRPSQSFCYLFIDGSGCCW